MPLQPNEKPTDFVTRVFNEVICDLSSSSFDAIPRFFHPSFIQHVDDKVLSRDDFVVMMRTSKRLLAAPPVFTWKKLIATEPCDGRIHVTSVHSVAVSLASGSRVFQKVVAALEIDVATGTLIHCDEVTRIVNEPAAVPAREEFGANSVGRAETPAADREAQTSRPASRLPSDRPSGDEPVAKLARPSTPPSVDGGHLAAAGDSPRGTPPRQGSLDGVALKRTGVSDMLGATALGESASGESWLLVSPK